MILVGLAQHSVKFSAEIVYPKISAQLPTEGNQLIGGFRAMTEKLVDKYLEFPVIFRLAHLKQWRAGAELYKKIGTQAVD